MILIGENLNVMSKKVGEALKQKDAGPVRAMAEAEARAGMDMLDINLGPARKGGPELMEWVIRTVREVTGSASFPRHNQCGGHRGRFADPRR